MTKDPITGQKQSAKGKEPKAAKDARAFLKGKLAARDKDKESKPDDKK
jgi:hypothetical protein